MFRISSAGPKTPAQRARVFLLRYLTKRQAIRYRILGSVVIKVDDAKYVIRKRSYKVGGLEILWKRKGHRYIGCVYPVEGRYRHGRFVMDIGYHIPTDDVLASYIIRIRANELAFHNEVNWSYG